MMFSGSPGKRSPPKFKMGGVEDEDFLNRIKKSMYYSRLPRTDRFSLPVTEFAAELFSEVRSGCTLERLDVEEAARISRNACVSPCAFVLSLLYLERLKGCNPEYLYKVAPAELFLVSLMIANKFLNDDGGDDEILNSEWAVCGNLSLNQVNKLEKEFLDAIEWRIFVDNDDFWNRLKKLERTIAEKEGRKRGWFSYWEMTCLMETIRFSTMIQTMVSVSSVFLAAYTAGVITLLGSALVASNVPGTSLSPRNTTKNTTTMTCNPGKIIPADGTEQLINFPRNFSDSTFEGRSEMKSDWWSFTSWLAELEASKAHLDKITQTDGKIEASSDFVASFVTDSHVLMQNSNIWNDLVTEINWRDTLTQSYLGDKRTWSYYMNIASRASDKRLIY